MTAERNTRLVRRAVEEIWNQGELELADMLFAPTYINHGGLVPDLVRGPEAIKSGVALYRTAFPALHVTVEAVETMEAVEEMVEVHWTARRVPPTAHDDLAGAGPERTLRGTMLCHIAGGQIAESWTTWDREGVLRQMGLVRWPHAGPDPPDGQSPG